MNGSEDGSKDSEEGSGSDSEDSIKEDDMADIAEEKAKDAGGEDEGPENVGKPKEEEPAKEEPKKEESEKPRKKKERASDADVGADENEPKKWNLRRNRPMLDFITMEELNAMDDYDSEDDNDWRPTMGKRKGKSSTGDGSDGEDDDEDDGSEGESSHHAGNKDDSSSSSEDEQKKKKIKIPSRNSGDDEELTNDSLTLSQSKSNEVICNFSRQVDGNV